MEFVHMFLQLHFPEEAFWTLFTLRIYTDSTLTSLVHETDVTLVMPQKFGREIESLVTNVTDFIVAISVDRDVMHGE